MVPEKLSTSNSNVDKSLKAPEMFLKPISNSKLSYEVVDNSVMVPEKSNISSLNSKSPSKEFGKDLAELENHINSSSNTELAMSEADLTSDDSNCGSEMDVDENDFNLPMTA